ncbi:leucine-rich repeat domain-containing protein [Flavobacterium procerum]|uniref:leucine-rich repeat domain-containing protein n=1 Tax=Flavobacterium procerum TaxID=1455569 RepID=UPI0035ECCEF0
MKYENTDLNKDYLKMEQSLYKPLMVSSIEELAAMQSKETVKALVFVLSDPYMPRETSIEVMLEFTNLEYLEYYGVPKMPDGIDKLSKLRFLSFHVYGSEIPDGVGRLKNLETLKLTICNNVTKIPENIYSLKKLKELELGGIERAGGLSSAVGNLSNLEKLTITSAAIDLPAEILRLGKLKYLVCQRPQAMIFKIKTLETLCTIHNQSEQLKGIKNLKNLKELSLSIFDDVDFDELNAELSGLKALKYLSLSGSYIEDLNALKLPAGIEVLILWSFRGIKEIPEFVYGLKNLKYLAVNDCYNLQYVPQKINQMQNLEYLELKYNKNLVQYPKFRDGIKVNIKGYGEL